MSCWQQGRSHFGHVKALSDAAGKVGADAVEADGELLEEAGRVPVDVFTRWARGWADHQLAQAGVDLLERQRCARKAKLWTDRTTGMGVLLAKFPADRFQHLRQAADVLYLRELRRDKDPSGDDPAQMRTSKQRMADVIYQLLTNRHPATGRCL